MKILVLGAGGMAGHMIAMRLQEKGHEVICCAKRKLSFCKTIEMDVTNTQKLEVELLSGGYDLVVNAVGVLQAGISHNLVNGIWINSFFPHWLAMILKDIPTILIHLSTDCVFSGLGNGGYTETSVQSANDYYGRSKALGEIVDSKNLTIRTSIIGPDINTNGTGLFHWFMMQTDEILGYRGVIWTGVTTLVLADAIETAALQKLTGLYHLVNNKTIDKCELLELFNKLRKESVTIIPSDEYLSNKSLIRTRTDFAFVVQDYDEMIMDLKKWIISYYVIYPHYINLLKD